MHGEELNYVFGYPLLRPEQDKNKNKNMENVNSGTRLSYPSSSDSFSRNEANLALSIIQFWSNFAATG